MYIKIKYKVFKEYDIFTC